MFNLYPYCQQMMGPALNPGFSQGQQAPLPNPYLPSSITHLSTASLVGGDCSWMSSKTEAMANMSTPHYGFRKRVFG